MNRFALRLDQGQAIRLIVLFALSALLVFLSHEFSREAGRVASIWPLNALLLAAVMRWPRIDWRFVVGAGAVANIAVDLAMGDTLARAALLTSANVLEISLCMILLQVRTSAFDITRGAHLARFIAVAGVFAPMCSSIVAATALLGQASFGSTFWTWFAADALGLLIFTPALLALDAELQTPTPKRHAAEFAIGLFGVAAVSASVFWQSSFPLLFLVPPALTFATFRLGIRGAGAGLLIVAMISIAAAVSGRGPTQLIDGSELERVIVLQAFLALMSLTTLPIAAALAHGERAREDLDSARADAERSERYYRTLADYSTDLVVRFGKGGVITYASPAVRMLGLSPEQTIGRTTMDFAAPEDRAFAAKVTQDLFSGAEPDRSLRREFRVLRADGSQIWLEGSPSIIRDASGAPVEVVSTYRDITARRVLEDKLTAARQEAEAAAARAAESEERYRKMAEISLDMIARMDLEGRIKFVSASSAKIMGYTPEELIGTTTMHYTHRDDLPRVVELFNELRAAGPNAKPRPYQFRARRKDGAIIWLEGIPRILYDQSGQPYEVQDSVRDITARKELELALAEATVAAESAARAKAEFLANMSHEIRTPLNSILGFSRLLEQSASLGDRERRYAELVIGSGRSLLAIVNDVLDISAIDAGVLRLESRPFSPGAILQEATDALRLDAEAKALTLDITHSGAPVELLSGDASRIRQVATNLIHNAVKFTKSGAVHVAAMAKPPENGCQTLRVEITDTGVGIDPNILPELFHRFTQADASISRRFGGSGLGLAITKNLVELMGGRLGAESKLHEGSTFWFELTLPIAEVRQADVMAAPEDDTTPSRKILIVDDVPDNRELLCALLAGHELTEAVSGEDAITKARHGAFDLVLMDIQMPGMDGMEATRALRASPELAQLPIIAVSAHALPRQVASFLEAGMNDYLPKPIEPEALAAMIAKWTGGAPRNAAPPASAVLSSLQSRFIARCRDDLRDLSAPDIGPVALRSIIHRLAGAAATFGFPAVGEAALRVDQTLSMGAAPAAEDMAAVLTELEAICARASAA